MKTIARLTRLTAAAAAAGCLCGAATTQADEAPGVSLRLNLRIDRSIESKVLVDVMASEAAAIWRPYGLRIEWSESPEVTGSGGLSMDALIERRMFEPEPRNGASALGRSFVDLAAPFHPIRASFEATSELLEMRPTRMRAVPRVVYEHDMARALGRVLAHEIGHVLLGAPYHTERGLMRASYQAQELALPDRRPFELSCGDIARLHSRLEILTGDPRFAGRRAVGTIGDASAVPTAVGDAAMLAPPCRRAHVAR